MKVTYRVEHRIVPSESREEWRCYWGDDNIATLRAARAQVRREREDWIKHGYTARQDLRIVKVTEKAVR